MNWPTVHEKDDGIRPAGRPDQCFYCKQSKIIFPNRVLFALRLTLLNLLPIL